MRSWVDLYGVNITLEALWKLRDSATLRPKPSLACRVSPKSIETCQIPPPRTRCSRSAAHFTEKDSLDVVASQNSGLLNQLVFFWFLLSNLHAGCEKGAQSLSSFECLHRACWMNSCHIPEFPELPSMVKSNWRLTGLKPWLALSVGQHFRETYALLLVI